MSKYNPAIHNRRSIRLKGYDYAQEGLYFITLCCRDRECIFGTIVNGEMILNEFGKIAENEWLNTPVVRKNIALHAYVIMPNHIHGIIEILENVKEDSKENIGQFKSPSQTVGAIVRGYKIATIRKIKDYIHKNYGDKGSINRGISWGELQFTPTYSPKAPTYAPKDATKTIVHLDFKIWQRNYFERIIWSHKAYQNIVKYIHENPKNWNEDQLNA